MKSLWSKFVSLAAQFAIFILVSGVIGLIWLELFPLKNPSLSANALEANAKETYTQQLKERGMNHVTVADVQFVPDPTTPHRFTGYIKYSDGMTIKLYAIIDPSTNEVMYEPRPLG